MGDELRNRLPDADADALADLLAEGLSGQSGPARSIGPFGSDLAASRDASGERLAPAVAIAQVIPGYRLECEVHRGGQGVVYAAIQESTKRRVALKVIREGPFAGPADRGRFLREVEILGELRHPQIVTIHDSGVAAGCHYFVMDYIPGQPLSAWLAAGPHPLRTTLELFVRICEAVNAAHLRGVIHRDLKPGNIQLDEAGEPHILDFGLAKRLSGSAEEETQAMTITGQFMGSLPWTSPEQARGEAGKIDTRTDVYSLGVMLYQMLTGRFPHDVTGDPSVVRDRILQAEPMRPRRVSRYVDDEIETIVLKCLKKDRERRYQTAGELARDVQRYLNGEPIDAKRDSARYVLRKQLRRHRRAVMVTAAIFALVTIGFATSLFYALRAETERARAEVERERAIRAQYVYQIAAARAAYDQNQVWRMKDLLYRCEPTLRGWEWYHLVWLSDRSTRTLRGHTGAVTCIALSADGQLIASGSTDGQIRRWDLVTGQCVEPPFELDSDVRCIAVNAGIKNRWLVAGCESGELWVWDLDTPVPTRSLLGTHKAAVDSVAFNPNADQVVSGCDDGTLRLWDINASEHDGLPFAEAGSKVTAVAFDPKGRVVASGNAAGLLELWDAQTLKQLRPSHQAHDGEIAAAAFDPQTGGLVSAGSDGYVRIWNSDLESKPACLGDGKDRFRCVAVDGERGQIAAGSNTRSVTVWNASTHQPVATLRGHDFPVRAVAFAPDGKVLSGSEDRTLKVWDPDVSPDVVAIGPFEKERRLCVSWRHPEGQLLAIGDYSGTITICDDIGNRVLSLSNHENAVNSIVFRHDRIASASDDETVRVWNVNTKTAVLPHPLRQTVGGNSVALSPEGLYVAFASGPGSAEAWDTDTHKTIASLTAGHAGVCVAFSPDGSLIATGGDDGVLTFWDGKTGDFERAFPVSNKPVQCIAFSSDSRRVVTGGSDMQLRVWNVNTHEVQAVLREHEFDVISAAFGWGNTRIASGSYDCAVRIWNAFTGDNVLTIPLTETVYCVDFSPDGRRIAAACGDGYVRIWTAATPEELAKNPETAFGLGLAARRLLEEGQDQRALTLFDEASSIIETILRDSHEPVRRIATRQVIEELDRQYKKQPNSPRAATWRRQLATIAVRIGSTPSSAPDHEDAHE